MNLHMYFLSELNKTYHQLYASQDLFFMHYLFTDKSNNDLWINEKNYNLGE